MNNDPDQNKRKDWIDTPGRAWYKLYRLGHLLLNGFQFLTALTAGVGFLIWPSPLKTPLPVFFKNFSL